VGRPKSDVIKHHLRDIGYADTDEDILSIARALYKSIGTPVAMDCLAALTKGDYKDLAAKAVKPEDYTDVDGFYVDYCAVSFLRKFSGFPNVGDDVREVNAKKVFYQAEADCKATNERFSLWHLGQFMPKPIVSRVIHRSRELLKDALGKLPPLWRVPIKFGPGSTSNCRGEFATIADKLTAYPECTIDAVRIVSGLNRNSPNWFNLRRYLHPTCAYGVRIVTDDFGNEVCLSGFVAPRLVNGNRFTMVPKTALTHRGIGIEPGDNVVWQLGHGAILSDRLVKLGLNKEYQAYENRKMAREASVKGEYATVDLSAASETISYELVKDLLPSGWFDRLASLRSPMTFIDGRWVELDKFSSMGNGFTFELETLIFWALTKAVTDELNIYSRVLVFGDDIIVRGEALVLLRDVFSFCGLTVNESKSFYRSGFNESCGGDFLHGQDVRPYFLKEAPTNALEWYSVVNGIRRMGVKHTLGGSIDPRFLPAWLRALSRIPRQLKFEGPPAVHDAWVHTDKPERWHKREAHGITNNRGLAVVPIGRPLDRYCIPTQWLTALYTRSDAPLGLRGKIARLRSIWLSIS
jgi:hypothetical protein